jgi:hypothetical protein
MLFDVGVGSERALEPWVPSAYNSLEVGTVSRPIFRDVGGGFSLFSRLSTRSWLVPLAFLNFDTSAVSRLRLRVAFGFWLPTSCRLALSRRGWAVRVVF